MQLGRGVKRLERWTWLLFLVGPLAANAADDPSKEQAPPYAVPQHGLLNDRFRLSLGAFYADTTTAARLSTPTGGVGADVDFENTLGLADRRLVGEAGPSASACTA